MKKVVFIKVVTERWVKAEPLFLQEMIELQKKEG